MKKRSLVNHVKIGAYCLTLLLGACGGGGGGGGAIAPTVVDSIDLSNSTVFFSSADGQTELVGYVFKPPGDGPFPAVVMLHGRSGPYSSTSNTTCRFVGQAHRSDCGFGNQTQRSQMWGRYWAEHGILALHVDSYGPRGFADGFDAGTHGTSEREATNERTVRPLDAEGALAYLRRRGDVRANVIALQGWSNGGSSALNTLYRQTQASAGTPGFNAALVFYPGCGNASLLATPYQSAAPMTAFLAANDQEVPPQVCVTALTDARAGAGKVEVVLYEGATHSFDDPGAERQSLAANQMAKADAMRKALALLQPPMSR